MRCKTLAVAGALTALPWLGFAQDMAPTSAPRLTFEEAWHAAEGANATLRARQAQLAAAEGARTDAAALLYNNPQLNLEGTRRSVPQANLPTERRSEWNAGISQTLEIAGQRGYRREAAEQGLTVLRAEIEDTRRQLKAEVAQAFYRVLALQQRGDVEEEALKLFDSTAAAVQKRRAAGEDTKLDANVAAVEAERARNQLALVREQLLDARAELAAKLQLAPGNLPSVVGDLAEQSSSPYVLERLLSSVEEQPRLRALAARQDSARARLNLERASRYPDVTVGVNVGREGPGIARERLTTLTVSVPVPLFKRNATAIGQASTELNLAQIERDSGTRDARARVHTLWARLQSLQVRVGRLQDSVLPALAENAQLSVKSQRAGQIGVLELIVVNRQALDARRDLIDALSDYQAVRYALEAAAGWPQQGSKP